MAKASANRREEIAKNARRKRRRGVPSVVVATLLVVALFFGGLFGFVIARRTSRDAEALQEANQRIQELENTLSVIGYSEEQGDNFVFDDSDGSEAMTDLSGEAIQTEDGIFWDDAAFADIEGILEEPAEDVVLAEFNGGQVTSSEVVGPYNEKVLAHYTGFSESEVDHRQLLQETLEEAVTDKVCRLKADELKLTELTDADMEIVRMRAEEEYQLQKESCSEYVDTSGMTAEEADAALAAYAEENMGYTLDACIAEYSASFWQEKLEAEITKDVTVTEDEIQAAYETLATDQEQRFSQDDTDFEFSLVIGETIAWIPEGYRYVKHIFLPFEDAAAIQRVQELTEQLYQLDPEADKDELAGIQSQLDEVYAPLEQQAETILAEMGSKSFEALIEEYGKDENMLKEPQLTQGTLVSASSFIRFSQEYVEGAMNLGTPGDISIPLRDADGIYIVKYVGPAQAGRVDLQSIHDIVGEEVLQGKKETAYNDQVAGWVFDADPKYYPERLL